MSCLKHCEESLQNNRDTSLVPQAQYDNDSCHVLGLYARRISNPRIVMSQALRRILKDSKGIFIPAGIVQVWARTSFVLLATAPAC
ncbi:hypothetical protein [Helicobacter aurati]|uniref:hypothetical protein n=1 Tax=Helicobacter aurati TaxID=137778 RepID=UPI0011C07F89|nr:hypothetical protein [Helicobacter aurati]